MSFPTSPARNKHRFYASLKTELISANEVIAALKGALPTDFEVNGDVYSYSDGPHPPLSRELKMIGVASQDVFRLDGEFSTLTTKNAATESLSDSYIQNAHKFAKFLRRLCRQERVAIGSVDKYQRFIILKPLTQEGDPQAPFQSVDFVARAFVGKLDEIHNFLCTSSETSEPVFQPSSPDLPPPPAKKQKTNDDSLWEPPGDNQGETFSWGASDQNVAGETNTNDQWGENETQVDEHRNEGVTHENAAAAATDDFYSNLRRNLGTRYQSNIYHMRNFNGWVKATLISELNPQTTGKASPLRVLDLACGKGGDLGKWTLHKRGISNYVGSDVAQGSLLDAARRAVKMSSQKLPRCTFTCADLGSDVLGKRQKLLTWIRRDTSEEDDPVFRMIRGGGVGPSDKFDVVSIQFAIHYMMQTRERARRFFQTVSDLLEIGGNLIATTIDARVVMEHLLDGFDVHSSESALISVGGGVCRIQIGPEVKKRIVSPDSDLDELFGLEYTFMLVEGSDHEAGVGDAVNLPEWLIPLPALQKLAAEAGLELEYAQNFHDFYTRRQDSSKHSDAHHAIRNMKVLNREGSISGDEWEISRLYCAVKFKKVRESQVELDDDEEEVELDPKQKAKLMMKAMKLAKEEAGNSWHSLSQDEKQDIIDDNIQKLAREGA